jgi:hypothetical protein
MPERNHDRERQEQQQGARQYEADELTELRRLIKELSEKLSDSRDEVRELRQIISGDGTKASSADSIQNRVTNIETTESKRAKFGWIALAAAAASLFDRIVAHFSGKP